MARKRQAASGSGGPRRCKTRRCQEPVFVRGVCRRCYRTYARLVASGQTDWPTLIERGLAEPAYQRRKTPAMRAYEEANL